MKVIRIYSLPSSGSSVLNILLDSVEGINGIGEISIIRSFWNGNRDALKKQCNLCYPSDCGLYSNPDQDSIYQLCAKVHDTDTIVDSSKAIDWYMSAMEDGIDFFDVVLYKYPHEHFKPKKEARTLRRWIHYYSQCDATRHLMRYRDLAADPVGAVDGVLAAIGHPTTERREEWWNTTTHVLGGHYSIQSQLSDADARIDFYREKSHSIFVDERWKEDSDMINTWIGLYEADKGEFGDVVKSFGGSVEQLIVELKAI